jgi:hypothetical protein
LRQRGGVGNFGHCTGARQPGLRQLEAGAALQRLCDQRVELRVAKITSPLGTDSATGRIGGRLDTGAQLQRCGFPKR